MSLVDTSGNGGESGRICSFYCIKCSDGFSSIDDLEGHIAADHLKVFPYRCTLWKTETPNMPYHSVCRFNPMSTQSALLYHYNTVHGFQQGDMIIQSTIDAGQLRRLLDIRHRSVLASLDRIGDHQHIQSIDAGASSSNKEVVVGAPINNKDGSRRIQSTTIDSTKAAVINPTVASFSQNPIDAASVNGQQQLPTAALRLKRTNLDQVVAPNKVKRAKRRNMPRKQIENSIDAATRMCADHSLHLGSDDWCRQFAWFFLIDLHGDKIVRTLSEAARSGRDCVELDEVAHAIQITIECAEDRAKGDPEELAKLKALIAGHIAMQAIQRLGNQYGQKTTMLTDEADPAMRGYGSFGGEPSSVISTGDKGGDNASEDFYYSDDDVPLPVGSQSLEDGDDDTSPPRNEAALVFDQNQSGVGFNADGTRSASPSGSRIMGQEDAKRLSGRKRVLPLKLGRASSGTNGKITYKGDMSMEDAIEKAKLMCGDSLSDVSSGLWCGRFVWIVLRCTESIAAIKEIIASLPKVFSAMFESHGETIEGAMEHLNPNVKKIFFSAIDERQLLLGSKFQENELGALLKDTLRYIDKKKSEMAKKSY